MTSQPTAGRPSHRVRLGIAGLGAVAQAVHLPLIERLRDAFEISAIADLSPSLTDAIGKIDVYATRSYVAIARAQAPNALARLRAGKIKGRKFRVNAL